MVDIDVKRAIALKNYSGDLSFEEALSGEIIDIPYVSFASPVKVTLHFEIFEDEKVEVTGSVSFLLKGLCSRCLSEAEMHVSGEVDALFLPGEENGVDYGYFGGRIKLEEAVRDAVMFALPSRFSCGKECEIPKFN